MIWSHFLNLNVRTSVCVLSHVWLFATPWTVTHQAPLSMEFSRQEYWSGLPFHAPGRLPVAGVKPLSLASPASAGGLFTTEPPGEPQLRRGPWTQEPWPPSHTSGLCRWLPACAPQPQAQLHSYPVTLYSYSLTSWGWKKILESWPLCKVQRNESPFMFSRISLIVELKSTPLNWERK